MKFRVIPDWITELSSSRVTKFIVFPDFMTFKGMSVVVRDELYAATGEETCESERKCNKERKNVQ